MDTRGNQKAPKVSVLLPYYNDKKFLKQSIESVLSQDYEDFELILINHASTDGSRGIARSYKDRRIVQVDLPKNQGAGGGEIVSCFLKHAKGEYLKFFCADDVMRKNCLSILVGYMEENKEDVDFCVGNCEYIDSMGKDLVDDWFSTRPRFSFENTGSKLVRTFVLDGFSTLPLDGALVKEKALREISFDHCTIMLFDMSMWVLLLLHGYRIGYCNKLVCDYRIHSGQVSAVENENKAARQCFFEYSYFKNSVLAQCKDIKIIQELFPNNKYAKLLEEPKDIPFVVNEAIFEILEDKVSWRHLQMMIEDVNYRKHLVEHFDFDIREFRKLYSYPVTRKQKSFGKLYCKTKKYDQLLGNFNWLRPTDLRIWHLLFLLIRRPFAVVRWLFLKNSVSKERKFSL